MLKGIADRNAAEALRGKEVEVDRADFPPLSPGEYYLADLIGLRAATPSGRALGVVTGLVETGAVPVLTIEGTEGETLVPLVEPFLSRIDIASGLIEVVPPEAEEPDVDHGRD